MKVFQLLALCALCLFAGPLTAFAQTDYFDRNGKACPEDAAYYKRVLKTEPDRYESRYTSNNQLYFEGRITNANAASESNNTYAGLCVWYYKNGQKKAEKNYDEAGVLNGLSTTYFESGDIQRQENYIQGKRENNGYTEYDEDGRSYVIFTEDFDHNHNDWDLYDSAESMAKMEKSTLIIKSKTASGTSRYISVPNSAEEFILEAKLNISKVKSGQKAGILFGFKDWDNYSFFSISNGRYSVGNVFEGVTSYRAENYLSSEIKQTGFNTLKIFAQGEKYFFSINGSIVEDCKAYRLTGRKCGFVVSGKDSEVSIDDFIYKQVGNASTKSSANKSDEQLKASGTGVIISKDGYILTNYHVTEKSKQVLAEINVNGKAITVMTKTVAVDKDNDLVLLKIEDPEFSPLKEIPYAFRPSGGIDVGTSVFTIGFPLAFNGMGKEPKFSDGKISAKVGYNNATNSFQTTIGVQPGNSGGPIFNQQGELIGIINATVNNTDNVSYGIKCSYIYALLDLAPQTPEAPSSRQLNGKPLEEQIKVLTNYVALIKVK